MATIATDPAFGRAAPALSVAVALVAGVIATLAFDGFGQHLSPALGFAKLAPTPLAQQVLNTAFGAGAGAYGEALHWATGVAAYSIGLLVLLRAAPWANWLLVSTIYGAALWAFALYVMAHLVAGNPPFLGFGQLTWVALAGHVLYGVVAGAIIHVSGAARR